MGEVRIRAVEDTDLETFYEQQRDPVACEMAAFPPRDRQAFMTHWATIRASETTITRTVVANGQVAGNIGSWPAEGRQFLGYWFGRAFWGRGIATAALALFLDELAPRPVYAFVAVANVGSVRVLEKCGFQPLGPDEPAPPPSIDDGVPEVLLVLR